MSRGDVFFIGRVVFISTVIFCCGWSLGASRERKRADAVIHALRERFPETFQSRMVRYKGTWITLENLRWLAGDSTDFKDLEELKP